MGESPLRDSYGSDTPSPSAKSQSALPSISTLPTREVVKSSAHQHANGCTPSTAPSSRPLSPVSSQTPPSSLRTSESAPLPPAHVSAPEQTVEPPAAQLDPVPTLTPLSAPAPIRHCPESAPLPPAHLSALERAMEPPAPPLDSPQPPTPRSMPARPSPRSESDSSPVASSSASGRRRSFAIPPQDAQPRSLPRSLPLQRQINLCRGAFASVIRPFGRGAGSRIAPPPPPPFRDGLSPHPLLGGIAQQATPLRPSQVLRLSPHPLLNTPARQPPPCSTVPSTPAATLVGERSPFPRLPPTIAHLTRSTRHKSSVPTRLDPSASPVRPLVIAHRRPLPPSPDSRSLVRTPDVYVAASLLNRNATAKQRGRRGFKELVVDAGWGLFLARDMKRNAVVLNYKFVDGRGGVEVDRLDADQLKARYPDPLQPATHVLQVWGSSIYWDTLRCKGVGGFANSCVGQQNCLFRGSKIHVGKSGCSAGTEVLVSYSPGNSYQWARSLEATDDFYARGPSLAPAGARLRQPPWPRLSSATPPSLSPTPPHPPPTKTTSLDPLQSTPSQRSLPEPPMRLHRRLTSGRAQPSSDPAESPMHLHRRLTSGRAQPSSDPAESPQPMRDPPAVLRSPPLATTGRRRRRDGTPFSTPD